MVTGCDGSRVPRPGAAPASTASTPRPEDEAPPSPAGPGPARGPISRAPHTGRPPDSQSDFIHVGGFSGHGPRTPDLRQNRRQGCPRVARPRTQLYPHRFLEDKIPITNCRVPQETPLDCAATEHVRRVPQALHADAAASPTPDTPVCLLASPPARSTAKACQVPRENPGPLRALAGPRCPRQPWSPPVLTPPPGRGLAHVLPSSQTPSPRSPVHRRKPRTPLLNRRCPRVTPEWESCGLGP